jgi:hypothetical protein
MSEPPRRRRRNPVPEHRWFDEDEEQDVVAPRRRGPDRDQDRERNRARDEEGDGDQPRERGRPRKDTSPSGNEPRPESQTGWGPPSKLTWVLFGLLATVLGVFAYLRDEAPPFDSDVMPGPAEGSPPSDMAAVRRMKAMLSAAQSVRREGLPQTPVWQWDTPTLSALLEQHSAVLDNFRDLLEEKDLEWQPRSTEWKKADFGADRAWPAVVLMKQVESAYLSRRGQEEASFLAAIDMAVLGGLLEQLDAWPSLMDRSLAFHEASTASLAELLRNTQLDAGRLKRLQEVEFKPFMPSMERLRAAMKGFYAYERKLLIGPAQDEPPLPPYYLPARTGWVFFKPHATLRQFADSFRELQKEPVLAAYARGGKMSSRLEHRQPTRRPLFDPNWSGTEYYQSRIGFYETLPDRVHLARFRHDAVMTLFAIRRYVITEARLPATLDALKGGYIDSVGIDPYTGESLRYNPEKGCLYSIGSDYRDEGGKPGPVAFADAAEPTVAIGIGMARAG